MSAVLFLVIASLCYMHPTDCNDISSMWYLAKECFILLFVLVFRITMLGWLVDTMLCQRGGHDLCGTVFICSTPVYLKAITGAITLLATTWGAYEWKFSTPHHNRFLHRRLKKWLLLTEMIPNLVLYLRDSGIKCTHRAKCLFSCSVVIPFKFL